MPEDKNTLDVTPEAANGLIELLGLIGPKMLLDLRGANASIAELRDSQRSSDCRLAQSRNKIDELQRELDGIRTTPVPAPTPTPKAKKTAKAEGKAATS